MRAMAIDRFGGSEELTLQDVPKPGAASGSVVIRMAYASINPADWKSRAGMLAHLKSTAFPLIIGFDGSGLVEAVGDGVDEFKVGDQVMTLSGFGLGYQGTYADYCCAPARRVFRAPEYLDLKQAATIPIAAASAASSIVDVAKVQAGQMGLVNGGSGSVGAFAIQFLRHLGCRVAATCSGRNVDHVAGLGAELVIDYTHEDIVQRLRDWAPDGVDFVIDTVGQHSLPAAMAAVIRRGGVLVAIQTLLTSVEAFDPAVAAERDVRVLDNVFAARTADPFDFQVAAFRQMLGAIEAGSVKTPPYEIMPLDKAGQAQDRVQGGHVRGKILLAIDPSIDV